MALQVVGTDFVGTSSAASTLTTPGIVINSGHLIVLGFTAATYPPSFVSSITDNAGNIYKLFPNSPSTTGIPGAATVFYYVPNCLGSDVIGGAPIRITVKMNTAFGTLGLWGFFIWDVAGASFIAPADAASAANGSNGSAGGAVVAFSTSFSKEIIFYALASLGTPPVTYAAESGFTLDASSLATIGGLQHEIVSTIQSNITPTMTGIPGTTTKWASSAVSFRDSSFDVATISGNVGKAGVTVNYSGPTSGSVTSGSNGNYAITNLGDGTYTITPSLAGFAFVPISQTVILQGVTVANVNFTTPYSVPDCRNYGSFPNQSRDVQGTLIYDVQTSSNHSIPPTDSRIAGAPVDCRKSPNIPQNSRKAGTFGPGE